MQISLLVDLLIILIGEGLMDDAELVDAVVFKTNVVLARAGKGLYGIKKFTLNSFLYRWCRSRLVPYRNDYCNGSHN